MNRLRPVVSVLRHMFLAGTLGLHFDWPDRIVRVSTAAFLSPLNQDEPPGLIGQMWLDFRALGPIVWAIVMTLQLAVLQRIYNRCRKTPEVVALYVVLFYIVSLVINTGSFVFTVSIDWVLLVMLSLFICRTRRLVRRSSTRLTVVEVAGGLP